MADSPPKLIAIDHDDYHAEHIGVLSDGRQFFLTTPFVPARNEPGCEFVALFIFEPNGDFAEATIESLGPRKDLDRDHAKTVYERLLEGLGDVTYQRIEVAPFSIEKFGVEFGLIPRVPEEEDEVWAVELMPGNYMAFFEPWDSGEYDT